MLLCVLAFKILLKSEHVICFVQESYSCFLCLCNNISVKVAKNILYLDWEIFNRKFARVKVSNLVICGSHFREIQLCNVG